MRRALLWGALALVIGCGGEDSHPPAVSANTGSGGHHATGGKSNKAGSAGRAGGAGTAGRGGSTSTAGKTSTGGKTSSTAGSAGIAENAGSAGEAGTAGTAGTAGAPTGAPVVTITAPIAALDPSSPNVLIADLVDVTCLASPANLPGATVDPTTVQIVQVAGTQTVAPIGTPKRDPVKGTTATFSLAGQPSGALTFVCTARDGTLADLRGTATLTTLLDRGPTLKINTPANKDVFALLKLVTVNFDVTTNRLDATDPGADIDTSSVALTIDGKPITATAAATTADKVTYQTAAVNMTASPFSSTNHPSGYTVVEARAKNKRGVEARATVTITVDDVKPLITIISPVSASIVSGEVWLAFDVVDPVNGEDPGSGVDENTVVVILNQKRVPYDPTDKIHWSHNGNNYRFMFTEADLVKSTAQATIQIIAADIAGNLNSDGATQVLYLDNVPPMLDLDPPTVREHFIEQNKRVCSDAFDPLGEAINDRQIIRTHSPTFRVLAWDKSNDPGGAQYLAGVKENTVTLWLQTDPRVPLLADTDGDGICDDINRGTADSQASGIALTQVAISGESPKFHGTTELVDDTRFWAAPEMGSFCSATTTVQATVSWLCNNNSDMVRVIRHNSETATPAVYGVEPGATGVECTGRYWDVGSLLSSTADPSVTQGWMCLAAVAQDGQKNLGISRVLRICYDDPDTVGSPLCAASQYALPSVAQDLPWVRSTDRTRSSQYPALPDCPCEAGQNYCLYQQDASTQVGYCSATKAHCYTDVDVSKITLTCATTEKLCAPRDPNRSPRCIPLAQSCAPDVDVATAVTTQCTAAQKLCIPWNPERAAYCVGASENCIADTRVDVDQCPSCLPTKYDVVNAKCTGELCPLGSLDVGCQPQYTRRCRCNPLCDAGSTSTPAGCTPYHKLPSIDPCAVNCRPPTNIGSIRFVRRD